MAAVSHGQVDKAHDAEIAVAKAHPWIERMARLGYAAKGIVYGLIGLLAILTVFRIQVGQHADEMNQRGMINFISRLWFGTPLLLAIAVGLAGYSIWRLISATINAENQGWLKRIGYLFSGLAYGYLAIASAAAVFGWITKADDKMGAKNLIDKPFGQILLFLTGVIIFAVAIGQAWNAYCGGFKKVLKRREMSRGQYVTAVWLGRIGLASRAVVFALIGIFFALAGLQDDARSAGGVTKALNTIRHSGPGNWLFVAVCLGLICYGAFMFFEAFFRRIRTADPELVEELGCDSD